METFKSAAEIACEKLKDYFDQCSEQEIWPQSGEVDRIIKENFAPVVNTRFEEERSKYRWEIIELNRRNLELDQELKKMEERFLWAQAFANIHSRTK